MKKIAEIMQSSDSGHEVVWARVDRDFYVANAPGAFLGCVDRIAPGDFKAYDARTQGIGAFPTLKAAMEAVVSGATEVTTA